MKENIDLKTKITIYNIQLEIKLFNQKSMNRCNIESIIAIRQIFLINQNHQISPTKIQYIYYTDNNLFH
jgi:hypothetical protein